MHISILTLFPDMFAGPFDYSIVKRAREKGIVTIEFINIRDFATDRYKSVDDHPYGGGVGMIMRVDVVDRALKSVKCHPSKNLRAGVSSVTCRKILLDPKGTTYTQMHAKRLSSLDHLILICGHYEGVDERIRQLADEQISIGDYVLTGGELPAMVIVDSIVRLLPEVLASQEATKQESFSNDHDPTLLEYPQYTKPALYNDMQVPDVLLSGNHKNILSWRKNHQRAKGFSLPAVD